MIRVAKLKKYYKQIAFALSIVMLLVWSLMGAGTSLAWFHDTSDTAHNVFNFADFEISVQYSQTLDDSDAVNKTSFNEFDSLTDVFLGPDGFHALYEPGFVQVVYFRIENKGSVPFKLTSGLCVTGKKIVQNENGEDIDLTNYLKYGIKVASEPSGLSDIKSDRNAAVAISNNWIKPNLKEDVQDLTDTAIYNFPGKADEIEVEAGGHAYYALVIRMPEEVGNEANYRGPLAPELLMGISFTATQVNAG